MMHLERLSSVGTENWTHINDDGCTAYAKQRMEEDNQSGSFKMFGGRSATGYPQANLWYSSWLFLKGGTPKVGSIACWDGDYGHVAYVERVNDDGSILVSQSNAFSVKWETKKYYPVVGKTTEGVSYGKKPMVFQGYLYNPLSIDNRVQNPAGAHVIVTGDLVRARKAPNGEAYSGRFIPHGTFNVLDRKHDGAFDWVKLDDDVWMALGSWATIVDNAPPSEPSDIDGLKKGFDEAFEKLANELNKQKARVKELEEKLMRVREMVNE